MSDGELIWSSIASLAQRIRSGELSPVDLVEALVARSEAVDDRLHAYLLPTFDSAREEAAAAALAIREGDYRGPLHGIPFGLKDIIDTAGIRTTCHSRFLEHNVPDADAEVARRLRRAGAILMGKLATHEFAYGGPSFDLPWPPARNPWNTAHHPGGSSSGSGAAVAAGMLPFALGTDTGGSVRNPSSCCGLVGMKATYGRVPRSGVYPLAFSLDSVGPMTRGVLDNALVLQALSGHHAADPASLEEPVPDLSAGIGEGLEGVRVGYVKHFHCEDMQAEAETAAGLDAVADRLADLGAEVSEARLWPLQDYAAVNRIILTVEGYAVHRRRMNEAPERFAAMTREKLLPGAFVPGPDYVDALRTRTRMCADFARTMQCHDVLICVSSMEPPCAIDDEEMVARTYPRQARVPFNLLGCPAMSVPCGMHSSGLPLSVQVISRPLEEPMAYRVAAAYEVARGPLGHPKLA
jgi:aspartyl-tRNA(Asn)/glutamyl-tRNA(Gln) amidotransferase subunit A